MFEYIDCIICGKDNNRPFVNITNRLKTDTNLFTLVKCECNFIYLNPRPTEKNISEYYLSDDYHPHKEVINNYKVKIYYIVQKFIFTWKYKIIHNIIKKGRILDIGGGKGAFAYNMSLKGWSVVMQDTIIINNAEKKMYSSVTHLKKLDNKQAFDIITLWHSLEHIHNIDDLFKEIKRLLLPNGSLIIAVPNICAPERKSLGLNWAPYDAPRHLYHFSPSTLNNLCQKYDFKILRQYSMFQDTPYNILLSLANNGLYQWFKFIIILIPSIVKTLIFGPKYSSSFLIICKNI